MKHKLLPSGLLFLLVGGACLSLEHTFYQYVDENGFLHESFFLPLGAFMLIVGALLIVIFMARRVFALVRKSG